MLNLSYIFEDANTAMAEFADRLAVVPLPAAVYMMQVDVLNHYRYALTHYLTLTLSEPYLQNSSLGTPYQKWAFFVNKNFEMLSFAVHNLLRYTSRLVHETQCPKADDSVDYMASFKGKSNTYTLPLCDIKFKDKPIGVRVHNDERLTVTAIRNTREPLEAESVDIRDRSRLDAVRERGMREISTLTEHNRVFGGACNAYYSSRKVAEPFRNLNQEYWT